MPRFPNLFNGIDTSPMGALVPVYFQLSDGNVWSCGYVPMDAYERICDLIEKRKSEMSEASAIKKTLKDYFAYKKGCLSDLISTGDV